jgi:hypothetical protein
MSTAQKDLAIKFFGTAGPWVISVLLGFVCFYLSEINTEFKAMKVDIQQMNIRLNKLETSIDYMTNYDLKKKN